MTFVAAATLGLIALAPSSGCSSKSNQGAGGDDGGSGSSSGGFGLGSSGDDSGPVMLCPAGSNFQCQKVSCPNGGDTTLSGTVYDPAGKIPLYNVAVYVPNTAPVTLPAGASCGDCGKWYTAPVVSTLTDEAGHFTLKNMPVGKDIPLMVQVGKWRMQYKLSNVTQCVDNDAVSLAGTTKLRMPKNHMEGDIPNIAVSTGSADSLECLLYRMGLDKPEYTGDPMGAGRIHIFTGGDAPAGYGGAVTNAPQSKLSYQYLWNTDSSMQQYDLVLLSCEGSPTSYVQQAQQQVLADYTTNGGRVFASHYHYQWFIDTGTAANPMPSPFEVTPPLATWQTSTPGFVGDQAKPQNGDIITTLPGGGPFPEGASLKMWLQNVGALTNGQLPIFFSRNNATVTPANTHSQPWVALDPASPAPNATQYFSFDTPIGASAAEHCGRVVYSDLHVSGGAMQQEPGVAADYPSLPVVPDGCADHDLTAQEKALEFMIFDLSSCLTPVGVVPVAPIPQ